MALLKSTLGELERSTSSHLARRDEVVEGLAAEVASVAGQVQQLMRLSRRHTPSHGVAPQETLLHAASAAVAGVGSFPDLCASLAEWVQAVDASQRYCAKNIRELWEWARAVDEDIRRVQRFTRPVFKA
jgi:hypothetical protein